MDKLSTSSDTLQDSWIFVENVTEGQKQPTSKERLESDFVQNVSPEELGEDDDDSESDGICVISEDEHDNLQCSICSCEDDDIQEDALERKENDDGALSALQECCVDKFRSGPILSTRSIICITGLIFLVVHIFYSKKVSHTASPYMNIVRVNTSKHTTKQHHICIKETYFSHCTDFCTCDLLGQRFHCKKCLTYMHTPESFCNITSKEQHSVHSEQKNFDPNYMIYNYISNYQENELPYLNSDKIENLYSFLNTEDSVFKREERSFNSDSQKNDYAPNTEHKDDKYKNDNVLIYESEYTKFKPGYNTVKSNYRQKTKSSHINTSNNKKIAGETQTIHFHDHKNKKREKTNDNFINERREREDIEYVIKEFRKLYKRVNEKEKNLKYLERNLQNLLDKVQNQLNNFDKGHGSDWVFQRARIRNELRNKFNWFLERGEGRKNIRKFQKERRKQNIRNRPNWFIERGKGRENIRKRH